MITKITLPNSKRVNVSQLVTALAAAAPGALIRCVQQAETHVIKDNHKQERVRTLDWEFEIEGDTLDAEALKSLAEAHTPEKTEWEEAHEQHKARELNRLKGILEPWIRSLIAEATTKR